MHSTAVLQPVPKVQVTPELGLRTLLLFNFFVKLFQDPQLYLTLIKVGVIVEWLFLHLHPGHRWQQHQLARVEQLLQRPLEWLRCS